MNIENKEAPSIQKGSIYFTREMTSNWQRIADFLVRKHGPEYDNNRSAAVAYALASVAMSLDESLPDFEYTHVEFSARMRKV